MKRKHPRPGIEPVLPLVLEDLRSRAADGDVKYGRPLETHNGLDALWEAYEEAMDLVMYLRQAIAERDDEESRRALNEPPPPTDPIRWRCYTPPPAETVNCQCDRAGLDGPLPKREKGSPIVVGGPAAEEEPGAADPPAARLASLARHVLGWHREVARHPVEGGARAWFGRGRFVMWADEWQPHRKWEQAGRLFDAVQAAGISATFYTLDHAERPQWLGCELFLNDVPGGPLGGEDILLGHAEDQSGPAVLVGAMIDAAEHSLWRAIFVLGRRKEELMVADGWEV